MRDIKFRAWDKKHKKMYDDVGVMRGECIKFEDVPFGEMLIFRDLILMQYTGLKDKNGKEIWEGDIIRKFGTNIVSMVEWDFYSLSGLEKRTFEAEVIGNVYENPELLVDNKK